LQQFFFLIVAQIQIKINRKLQILVQHVAPVKNIAEFAQTAPNVDIAILMEVVVAFAGN